MADEPIQSIRQQIVDAIKIRFGDILQENDYETDIGKNVYFWLLRPLSATELPAIICRDRLRTEWKALGSWNRFLDVNIELHIMPENIDVDDGADGVMRQIIADLETAIGTDPMWGGLAEDTSLIENEEINIEAKNNIFIAVLAKMTIEYSTLPWNPYE